MQAVVIFVISQFCLTRCSPQTGYCQPFLCPLLLEQFQLVFLHSILLKSFIALLKPLVLVTFLSFLCYCSCDRLLSSKVSSSWFISRVVLRKYVSAVKQTLDICLHKLHNNPYVNFLSNYYSHISGWFYILVNGLENVIHILNKS
jgi:hypothetical protein